MNDDERCCGTGTCLINAQGVCWCGQQWDGSKMCRPTDSVGGLPDTSDTATECAPVQVAKLAGQ